VKIRRILALGFLVAAFWGCQLLGGTLIKGAGYDGMSAAGMSISQYSFSPGSVSFPAANTVTVTWKNNDGVTHNVTSDNGAFTSSPDIRPGGTYALVFSTPGTFHYHCSIHTDMTGTVTVN
jgi:plastocyanin